MSGLIRSYRSWHRAREDGYGLPYRPMPLHCRFAAAWVDFVPPTVVVFFYLYGNVYGNVAALESDFLRDLSFLFLSWNLPRVVAATLMGRSLGQALLGGVIGSAVDGSRVTASRAGFRNLLTVLDYVPGFILVNLVMVLCRRDRRTVYDCCTGTVVVDARRSRPEDWSSQVERGEFEA